MASNSDDLVTVVLGDEFDDALRARLMDSLRQLGAIPFGSSNKFLAGSQEMEEFEVLIEGDLVHVETETYVGLSITGRTSVIKKIQQLTER